VSWCPGDADEQGGGVASSGACAESLLCLLARGGRRQGGGGGLGLPARPPGRFGTGGLRGERQVGFCSSLSFSSVLFYLIYFATVLNLK